MIIVKAYFRILNTIKTITHQGVVVHSQSRVLYAFIKCKQLHINKTVTHFKLSNKKKSLKNLSPNFTNPIHRSANETGDRFFLVIFFLFPAAFYIFFLGRCSYLPLYVIGCINVAVNCGCTEVDDQAIHQQPLSHSQGVLDKLPRVRKTLFFSNSGGRKSPHIKKATPKSGKNLREKISENPGA